jgi:hypothetical protein
VFAALLEAADIEAAVVPGHRSGVRTCVKCRRPFVPLWKGYRHRHCIRCRAEADLAEQQRLNRAIPVRLIRDATRAALAAKKARGERAGKVPFGYTVDAAGRLAPDANEQAIIAEVLALRDRGVSLRGIVAALEGRGFRSRAGKPLQLTQVARIARGAA